MTRYEELDRKAYSCIGAANRVALSGNHRNPTMEAIWTHHALQLMDTRDGLTIADAEAPAMNPRMGTHALV